MQHFFSFLLYNKDDFPGEKNLAFSKTCQVLLYILTSESCHQSSFLSCSTVFLLLLLFFIIFYNQQLYYLKYDSNGNIFWQSVVPEVKSSLFHNHICSALLLMSGTEVKKKYYVQQKVCTDIPRIFSISLSNLSAELIPISPLLKITLKQPDISL